MKLSFNFLLPGEVPEPPKPRPTSSMVPESGTAQQAVILKPVVTGPSQHQALPPPRGLSHSDAQLYMRLCEIRKLTNIHASSGAEFLEGEPPGPTRLFRRKKKRPAQPSVKEEVIETLCSSRIHGE